MLWASLVVIEVKWHEVRVRRDEMKGTQERKLKNGQDRSAKKLNTHKMLEGKRKKG